MTYPDNLKNAATSKNEKYDANNMYNWKYFFFDFNFTIADTKEDIIAAFNLTFKNMGLKSCTDAEIINTIGLSLKDAFIALQKDYSEEHIAFFCKEIQRLTKKVGKNSYLYDSVKDLFKWLHSKGFKIGIVTSNDYKVVKTLLKRSGCFKYVDVIIDGNNFPYTKPNPSSILRAMDIVEANNTESVFIGDCLVDAQAAKNANVDFVAVLTGWESKKRFLDFGTPDDLIFKNILCLFKTLSNTNLY